ncbi:MAG: hypothetical protein HOC95_04425 [Candidatus Diapherotrites archaeon]|jgi:uncharacterized protein (UPF0333 family)|nr:hypothetical protein [Candidatus Diapherotrites archaeon]
MIQNKCKGQVSIEYLLLLAAFFSALIIILPQVSFAVDQFFATSDTLLAKQIANTLEEEVRLFDFLGNDSKKEFSFSPAKEITLTTQNAKCIVATTQKQFSLTLPNAQPNKTTAFTKRFNVKIQKQNDLITITFS